MADRANEHSAARDLRSHRGRSAYSSRRIGIDCVDFSPEPEIRLSQRMVEVFFWPAISAVQCLLASGNDLGPLGGTGSASISDDGRRVQIDGPVAGRIRHDVGRQYLADFAPRHFAL